MKIVDICIDGGTQSRAELDDGIVADYATAIRTGTAFPAVIVFFDGSKHWLADGFHRYHAHKHAGAIEIDADIRKGTKRDAVLYSVGANQAHGLRRSNDDKRKAVQTLLADAEWASWSDREISRHCGVAASFVGDTRKAICSQTTDSAKLRKVKRNGKEYAQATANIGAKPAATPVNDSHAQATQVSAVTPAVADIPPTENDQPTELEVLREQAADYAALKAENEQLHRIVAADDIAKAALAEVTRFKEQVRVLTERNNGLMNEKNLALSQAKMWMNKFRKLEKEMSNADSLGVAF